MKALTVQQPWATLIAIGAKRIETRSWQIQWRGLLAIHASQKRPDPCWASEPFRSVLATAGYTDAATLPRGAVVAIVELVTLRLVRGPEDWPEEPERSFGDYASGRWLWELRHPRPIAQPVPARGRLGLWEWPGPVGEIP